MSRTFDDKHFQPDDIEEPLALGAIHMIHGLTIPIS